MKRLWNVGAWFAAAAVSVPLATVLWALVAPAGETWRHLRATVLADYAVNTVLLALSVGTFATVVGVGAAWTVAAKDFPGRRFLSAALVLPLATPAYVVAYVYTDMLDYAGAGANGAAPCDGLAGWRLRVPGNPFASRRRVDARLGALSLRLRFGPGGVCQPSGAASRSRAHAWRGGRGGRSSAWRCRRLVPPSLAVRRWR